ncbi:MAG: efflux RND transporter periplasmic adaptor subunit [Caldilineaceae bacterium]|nr:efflux RND transporter periplasmic adaptor subunit [Caldilineaceae bacterium]
MRLFVPHRAAVSVLVSFATLLFLSSGLTPFLPSAQPALAQTVPGADKAPSGVGRVDLAEKHQVVIMVGGIVDTVTVEVGDVVKKGDVLVTLNTQELEWSVQQAEMGLESARLSLAKLNETVEATDVAQAEAAYLLAKENLTVVERGPTTEELNAAENSAASAWAAYEELKAGPTQEQLTQANASLRRAEIARQEAQRAYDKIAWMPEAGTTGEAAALQNATISYEAAKAAYDETIQPAKASSLQSTLASAQRAQDALNVLKSKPTPAELAGAKASLASAEATLAKMQKGPNENDLRQAEIGVEQALIALEKARLNLENARVVAPLAGTVLAVNVEPGVNVSGGAVVVTLADTRKLKLTVNVEQKEIRHIQVGQSAAVSVYALPDHTFTGIVDLVIPVSDTSTGLVNYPVTLRLTDESLAGLLPGMTATALFTVTAPTE